MPERARMGADRVVVIRSSEAASLSAVLNAGCWALMSAGRPPGPLLGELIELLEPLRGFASLATGSGSGTGGCGVAGAAVESALMGCSELAEAAGISLEAARKRCRRGQVSGASMVAGRWLIPAETIDEERDGIPTT